MPPPATKKQLTAEQKETLRRWLAAGAEYQPHWSFIPPQQLEPPAVRSHAERGNEGWVRNPIDRFILSDNPPLEVPVQFVGFPTRLPRIQFLI